MFLKFLADKLLGDPNEEGKYQCPMCNAYAVTIRPHDERYKDRLRCWSCSFWGDEFDLRKAIEPKEDYEQRMLALEKLKSEYESSGDIFPPGDAEIESVSLATIESATDMILDAAEGTDEFIVHKILATALEAARKYRVSIKAITKHWPPHDRYIGRMELYKKRQREFQYEVFPQRERIKQERQTCQK